MKRIVMLDTGPLGRLAHAHARTEVAEWVDQLLAAEVVVVIPEITDYELRRNLLLEGLSASGMRLDELKDELTYLPLTTAFPAAAETGKTYYVDGPNP
ncbi:MAG: hypothetical protein COZ06_13445 [Armatimonadetes bacterium CG_4_10_14_3_um_filter_66_18]|nr:hypothetical protein [Armatimonadota bacterium]OIP00314.1 MAG: hypothetical protein AUJ96_18605 [Armatimonadetes bacterium CG2_30_66_41]PIU92368.1 MAG: hypothetical protein COS65_18165 [Armatimonadetes bacterium CG06_land_8_20_14_3_00_66_21]PIW13084.1 MAG: hypothetical protein COW34_11585 [Armatimonadetes bacterium CG17_big_fil_post_rev_8_21_14_2_50_66_6]PIX38313.1 MAG: hypothetical protein COZ57_31000 [Armatimonadetes bacterium CG_4_8_14_3_um_filter_66_20]PIY49648.1 MAG: hypothetical prote